MAKRTVRRMDVDGVVRDHEEDYDPEFERIEQEWAVYQHEVMTKPAAETVLNDPDIMKLWCEFDYRWTNVEHGLYQAFDAMLNENWWVTRPIYYTPLANTVRREMVEEAARAYYYGDPKGLKA